MMLGSYNSWSYIKPKKWWMYLFRFTTKCQDVDIKTQYEKYNVRCFDLHIKEKNDRFVVAYGFVEYAISLNKIQEQLRYLNYKEDVYIRLTLEIKSEKYLTTNQIVFFTKYCKKFEKDYKNIKFCGGNVSYNRETIYDFKHNVTFDKKHISITKPLIDNSYPKLFAKNNNKRILNDGTNKDVLFIDFVNIK